MVKLERTKVMSAKKKRRNRLPPAIRAHVNALLDEALEETFPASDPISICHEIKSLQYGMIAQAPPPRSSTSREASTCFTERSIHQPAHVSAAERKL